MVRRAFFAIAVLAALVGLPGAFFTIALPAQMRDGGASLFQIGFIWIVWLPSALKWLWAPYLERLAAGAQRRSWAIFASAVLLATVFLAVAPLAANMAIVPLVALAAFCATVSLSLQLLYSGWIMGNLGEAARGQANGWAAAGMVAGGIIGGGLLPWAVGISGWWSVVAPISVTMALAGMAGFMLRDQSDARPPPPSGLLRGWAVLRQPLLLVCISLIGLSGGADMMLPARLVDAGLSPEQTGLLLGTVALSLMVPVSLLAGWLTSRWPLSLSFFTGAMLKVIALLALAACPPNKGTLVAVLSVTDFVLAGALTVLTWQFYMHHAQGPTPIATYAVLTSTDALMRFASAPAAGLLAGLMGYSTLFVLAAVLIACAGVLAARLIVRT